MGQIYFLKLITLFIITINIQKLNANIQDYYCGKHNCYSLMNLTK